MTVPSLEKIDGLLEQRKGEIERERARGIKVAGYICCRVPPELIHSHGMIPVRLGRAVESQMTVGKEYIHQFTCPFIKCLVGEFLSEGTFYHDNVDVITGSVICLTVSRAMEVLMVYTGSLSPSPFYLPVRLSTSSSLARWNGSPTSFPASQEASSTLED